MESVLEKYLQVGKEAALKAGEYLETNFLKNHSPKYKTDNDVGLIEDKESEQIILSIIKAKYPFHNIYSEEIGEIEKGSEFTWFIDPLDGTNNYYAGIPYFSVSIALLKGNEVLVGVVYNPISKQIFEATKGNGAYLNGSAIKPSMEMELRKSVCSFIQGHLVAMSEMKEEAEKIKTNLSQNCRRVISTWAPALDWCLLASGGINGLVSFESELEDMYAGLLIAKEAGVGIYDFNGKAAISKTKRIVASNNPDFIKLISTTNPA